MHQRKRSVHARVFLRVMDVAVSPYTLSDTVLFSTVGMCASTRSSLPPFLPFFPHTTLHRNARTRPWLDRPSGMSNVLMGKSNGPLALGVIQYTHVCTRRRTCNPTIHSSLIQLSSRPVLQRQAL